MGTHCGYLQRPCRAQVQNRWTRKRQDTSCAKLLEGFGGPGRDRTDDLFHAMEARSQLRHRPTFERNCCCYSPPQQALRSMRAKQHATNIAPLREYPKKVMKLPRLLLFLTITLSVVAQNQPTALIPGSSGNVGPLLSRIEQEAQGLNTDVGRLRVD